MATSGASDASHSHWRGLDSPGCRKPIDQLELVQATVYEANAASRRVLEKLGLWAFGRLRLTPDDLTGVDTFHAASGEPWDGADILYRLDRAGWRGGPD